MTKHNGRARKIWSKEGASAREGELPLLADAFPSRV